MADRDNKPPTRDAQDSPTAWFVVLETARRAGNTVRADEALRQLERLGVKVTYTLPTEGMVAHAR